LAFCGDSRYNLTHGSNELHDVDIENTMEFRISLAPSAGDDIKHFKSHEQRLIVAAIKTHLKVDAEVESHRRKRLRLNPLGPWELRVGNYRVFYVVEVDIVTILAVGHKEHNILYIRGRRVSL
jgi:mRNA-degrading endonuclease RelE of RelBE toxin-antitoxin system